MQNQELLDYFLVRAKNDPTIQKSHITLFLAIYYYWLNNEYKNPVNITRRSLMLMAKIRSTATYHRCIKDLDELGFLKYKPSYNPIGSFVYLPIESLDII